MRTVPRSFHLETLSEEDCWKLFMEHAFCYVDPASRPDLVNAGRKIIAKCKGLPLAVKSIGGLLRSSADVQEWEKILRSELWELPERESNVLPALWLSYIHLPSELKRCFAYASIFPKDHEFEKEMLISLWMAEDLLETSQRNKAFEETGEDYFRELVSRSLFQRSSRAKQRFTMHDLVNDLATFVSGDFCLRLDDGSRVVGGKARRLSYTRRNVSNAEKFKAVSEAKHLRTFLPLGFSGGQKDYTWNRSTLLELLSKLPSLRVVSLSFNSVETLPDSFGKLRLLRFIDLSRNDIEEVPNFICILQNLQTLLLSNCKRLNRLPSDMGKLIKLRCLDVKATPLIEMPQRMGNMTDLQALSNFVLGQGGGSNIKELGRLEHLRGELCISGLENVCDAGDALEANLADKKHLRELSLIWDDTVEAEDSNKEREVLDKLRPHTNLKKLSIHSYKGTSFPNWVGSSSLSQMSSMYLSKCKSCFLLPQLWQLPSLKELFIIGFDVVVEFGPTGSFRSLERLTFQDMSMWKQWRFHEGSAFPCLKTLVLKNCPRLLGSLPNVIESLEIQNCPRLELSRGQAFETLDSLEVSQSCDSMTSFALNLFPSLSALELHDCLNLEAMSGAASPRLKNLRVSHSKLTSDIPSTIDTLSLSCCDRLDFPGQNRYASLVYLTLEEGFSSSTSFPLGHLPRLHSLYLHGFPNLESFGGRSFPRLQILTLVFCWKLKVEFGDRFPALRKLRISLCEKQESFPDGRLVPNLTDIGVLGCGILAARLIYSDLQSFTCLRYLSIDGSGDELQSYPDDVFLLPTSLVSLHILYFPKLRALNGSTFRQLTCLETLKVVGCPKIDLLPEEDLPASLSNLYIDCCPSLKQMYNKQTGERWPRISHIRSVII